jgi:hypothetical protein
MGYDDWLERPYQQRFDTQDAFEKFCEEVGEDPDTENEELWERFEEARRGDDDA